MDNLVSSHQPDTDSAAIEALFEQMKAAGDPMKAVAGESAVTAHGPILAPPIQVLLAVAMLGLLALTAYYAKNALFEAPSSQGPVQPAVQKPAVVPASVPTKSASSTPRDVDRLLKRFENQEYTNPVSKKEMARDLSDQIQRHPELNGQLSQLKPLVK